jgi:hypothetical protein
MNFSHDFTTQLIYLQIKDDHLFLKQTQILYYFKVKS